jgi:type I restriction-modification system, S subunit (fragment)
MDTKALRQKILDLAIRGKLVPQDPNDEPASVLLERIRAEKQQMVKNGKLKPKDIKNDTVIFKGDDNLHYEQFQDGTINEYENELPFEIPSKWVWCNLGMLFSHNTGKALNASKTDGASLTYITTSNVYWNSFELGNLKIMPFTDSEIEKCTVKKGDLLVCEGGDIGRAAIWQFENEIRIQNHLHRLRPYDRIYTKFYYYIMYLYKANGRINGNGIGLQGLSSNALHNIIVPVPPVEEQKRIVDSIDSVLSLIEQIESHKQNLSSQIDNIKSKILDLAIRGKLVPQDPNDEPASVLLERIRAEKEELIKQGKIKRDKKESVIFKGDDNSYYQDLPSNWIKIRLSTISEIITKGTTPRGGKVAYSQSGIGFLRAENIAGYDKLDLSNLNYVDDESHNNYLKRSILKENDILITIAGTLGRTAIVPQQALPLNTNQAVAIVRLVNNRLINVKYLVYALNSPIIKSDLLAKSVDMAIPNLSLENIADCNISLPPLVEQKRIVDEIEKIFAILDDIANQVA